MDYSKGQNSVKHLKDINDTAEKDIKLIEEYNQRCWTETVCFAGSSRMSKIIPICTHIYTLKIILAFSILIAVNQFGNVTLLPTA